MPFVHRCGNLARFTGIACLLAAASGPLLAGDVESWNEFNLQLWNKNRFAIRARGAVRLRNQLQSPYDTRAGAEVRFTATRRVALAFGYALRNVEYAKGHYDISHRVNAGANDRILYAPSRAISGSSVYERDFNLFGRAGINRLRQVVEFEVPRWRVSPWTQEEVAFQSIQGFARNRVRMGLVWRFSKRRDTFRVAYQYQQAEGPRGWATTHAVFTQLNLTL
jgi:hypothetical protein